MPPISRPATICRCCTPIDNRKVADTVNVTTNSAALTVPMVVRAWPPRASRVDVAIGPQPPPPLASSRPAKKPSTGTRRISPLGIQRPAARARMIASTSRYR
jgi:hypothetical protein